jgi:hypothetical protein
MYSCNTTLDRNEQKLQKMQSDIKTMKENLAGIAGKMSHLLPDIELEYKPMTTADWRKLVQQANYRCKHPKSDKLAVAPCDIGAVVDRLEKQNPHGLPRFKNKHAQWQTSDLESDLFGGDYTFAYIAPRLVNQALILANTEHMRQTPTGMYRIQIKINHNLIYLGNYHHRDMAAECYKAAKQEYLILLADHYEKHLPIEVTERLRSFIV